MSHIGHTHTHARNTKQNKTTQEKETKKKRLLEAPAAPMDYKNDKKSNDTEKERDAYTHRAHALHETKREVTTRKKKKGARAKHGAGTNKMAVATIERKTGGLSRRLQSPTIFLLFYFPSSLFVTCCCVWVCVYVCIYM